MAILAANKSGLKFEKIINVIHKLKSVEGRLEKIGKIKNNSKVILDYAHTPEALKLALLNLKEQFPMSKISLVFGCGGERDFKKRSLMGKIAEKYSDKIYLTDDNPRNENPSRIRKDIKKGIKKIKIQEGLIVPVMDARRDEVYSAIFDHKFYQKRESKPEIIYNNSFFDLIKEKKIYMVGNGQEKCKRIINEHPNLIFSMDKNFPSSVDMIELSYEKYKSSNFEDIAYFEPDYLKKFGVK